MESILDFNLIIDAIQVFIGLVTACIAWKVYKKLIPSELKKRQLEAVLELVQHLNTYTFTIHRMYYSGAELMPMSSLFKRNMFEYRAAFLKKENSTPIAHCKMLLLSDNTQPFELSKFIENPLMPKKIVPHLSDFISMHNPVFMERLESMEKVIVFNEFDLDVKKEMYYKGTATALSSHEAFLSSINGLYDAIEEWCRLNGLEDLNFRIHNSRNLNV